MKVPRRALWVLTIIACISFAVMVGESRAAITATQAKSKAVARAKKAGPVETSVVQATTLEGATAELQNESQPLVQRAEMRPELDEAQARPTFVVTTTGHFTDTTARVPMGQGAPTGTVLMQAYDAQTGYRVAMHLGGSPTASIARHRAHAAMWADGCMTADGHHCYAITRWEMENANEKIYATESDIQTTVMNIPDAGSGGTINNEKWTGFPGTYSPTNHKEYWVEVGSYSGWPYDCCVLRWFTAYNRGDGYGSNESPWIEPYNAFIRYSTVSQLNNRWCYYVEGGAAGCVGGFPVASKDLEVGIEAITNVKPSNAMQEQSNVAWTDWSVHPWSSAHWEKNTGFCMQSFSRENPPHYYPGNMSAGTC